MEQASKAADEARKQEEADASRLLDQLAKVFDGFQKAAEEEQARAAAMPYPRYEARADVLPAISDGKPVEHARRILDLIQEKLASDPAAYYHKTRPVAELSGLPELNGPNAVFGRAFLRELQKALVVEGAKRGLYVNAVFDWRTGPSSYGMEVADASGRRWDFRIENDYGDAQAYWDAHGSFGAVYLTIREAWEPREPGLGDRLMQYSAFQPAPARK